MEAGIAVYRRCRDVCLDVISSEDICTGGEGLHVEIDESHLWTCKYHRGKELVSEQTWMFGGICREANESFIVPIPNTKGVTFWPIIMQTVATGSIVLSDAAQVYKNLHRPGRGFTPFR
jgi:hypothetical protein